jgi:putative membrane protein (TIGR04086 family)
MNGNDRNGGVTVGKIFKNGLVSFGASYAICAVLTVLCTGFAMMAEHPRQLTFLGRCVFFAGAAVCGFICGKKTGKQGFLCGLVSGVMYCLTTVLLSAAVGAIGGGADILLPFSGVLVSVFTACVGCTGSSPKNTHPTGIKRKKTVKLNGYNK